jgi:phenylacetate-coenzyme A ligase PaaK-like adenylate-forming protein
MDNNLQVPAGQLKNVQDLCDINLPYQDVSSTNKLFAKAMRDISFWHYENSTFIKKYYDTEKFNPSVINDIQDISNIPFIFANFFKHHEIKSIDDSKIFLHLTSSGTTGQKSQMFFDEWTIKSAQRMVADIFNHYEWITPNQKCNYLLYTYEPVEQSKLGTAYTDNFLCGFAPINNVFYTLRLFNQTEHKFDLFGTIDMLQKFAEQGLPVRIFGFPSFFYFTLQEMEKRDLKLSLHPDSLVFLGGGWKGAQDKAIAKIELYNLVTKQLGIPDHRLRDGFGSVEHCIPYVECENHNFHVPVWSRIVIRDILNLQPLPYGSVGYLNFISPYITSVPAHSVLMGDLATLHQSSECGCSCNTEFFKIVGRAGVSATKSCAISASELIKEYTR